VEVEEEDEEEEDEEEEGEAGAASLVLVDNIAGAAAPGAPTGFAFVLLRMWFCDVCDAVCGCCAGLCAGCCSGSGCGCGGLDMGPPCRVLMMLTPRS
jgi:hypothetical protein